MGDWNVPTNWKNRNDLVDMMDYGQFSYVCEVGIIKSEHAADQPAHFSLNTDVYGQSGMTLLLAGREDEEVRRVVWFAHEKGMLQMNPKSVERFLEKPSQATSKRYEALLSDFVGTKWSSNTSVLEFYESYGPLWADRLSQNLYMQNDPREEDGMIIAGTFKRGESIYFASMQAKLVSVLLRIREAISQFDDVNDNAEAARNLALELWSTYGEECQQPYPRKLLILPEPAGYGWGFEAELGNAVERGCPNVDAVQQLRWIAISVIDSALKHVELHLEGIAKKDSPNYGVPVLRYRPKNLIALMYLLLAMLFLTPDNQHFVRSCPVCGDMFFPVKSHCTWHNDKCRMRIERALKHLGISTKVLSPREKVSLYRARFRKPTGEESRQ